MSQITTHILDTTSGQPAAGVAILLFRQQGDSWQLAGQGQTNADGRLPDLVPPGAGLPPGVYKMKFLTREYFSRQATSTFYPYVEIVFDTTNREHCHIPLLLSPFGYTTYRGS